MIEVPSKIQDAAAAGSIRLFPNFPRMAGIITNRFSTFNRWPCIADNEHGYKFGDTIETQENGENHFLARSLEADFFLKIVPQHGNDISRVLPLTKGASEYLPGDGILQIRRTVSCQEQKRPVLLCNTADCPIIVFYAQDRGFRAVAIVHSGWKGTRDMIVLKAIYALNCTYSFRTESIHIGMWPGICGDCYEVGEDVAGHFPKFMNSDKLDLKAAILDQIAYADIPTENIHLLDGLCSKHSEKNGQPEFCSVRREGENQKRNIVFIV